MPNDVDMDFQTLHLRQRIEELKAERDNPDMIVIPYIKCLGCRRMFFACFRECVWCGCPRS